MSKIILITGPPGSGKTTIARSVASHFPKSVHLQVDQFPVEIAPWVYNYLETMPKAGWMVLGAGDGTIEQSVDAVLHPTPSAGSRDDGGPPPVAD